jgi:DNA-binding response OmpR family regulator
MGQGPASEEGSPKRAGRPVILVADDDQDILDLVVFRFERAGFDVMAAVDGQQAVDLVQERIPDCAVLDIVMPKLDGLEVMRKLRADEKTSKIPVVLLTARTREHDVILGLESGADEYVKKPFDTFELLARVRGLLGIEVRAQEQEPEPT